MASRSSDDLEIFSRNHQPWLKESSYTLQPYYRLDLIPSWILARNNDESVPEFRFTKDGDPPKPCDPLPTYVYYLGNIRVDVLEVSRRVSS